jgi:hypothetical protein
MSKKTGHRFEAELDWYYISKESLRRWVVLFVLLAAGVVWGVWTWVRRGGEAARRAGREIAAAEELLDKARALPEAGRLKEEIGAAAGKVLEARTALQSENAPEAVNSALEAQSIAKRLLGGLSSAKGDAAVLDFGGKVEVQRANRATWEAARTGMALFEGDFLKTGGNGVADVMASDGTMYRIKPETLFEVHRTRAASGGPGSAPGSAPRGSEIKFIVGTVDVNTGEGSRSIVRTDAVTADIAQRSSVGLDVDSARNTGISTFRGSAELSTGGGAKMTLGERERAVASASAGITAKVKLPESPKPIAPDENTVLDARKKDPVVLRWTSVKDAGRYRLQIAQSRLFVPDSIVTDLSDRTRPEATVSVRDEGSYYWRVASVARGSGLLSEWSAARRFKVLSGEGRAGVPDTVPPDLVLQRPQVNGTLVIVSGRTEPGASVTVNGETADIDPSGSFKKIISLQKEGLNVVEVRAVDGAGNQTVRRENVIIQIF